MRLKAIPMEVESAFNHHPYWVLGGAAVLAIGAYYYFNATPPDAVDGGGAPSSIPFSYGMPQMAGVVQGGAGDPGGVGVIGSSTDPNALTTADKAAIDLQWAALDLAKVKEKHEYSIAQDTLAQNLSISQTNAMIAAQGIQSVNYQTDAMLAQSFIASGSMFAAGNVGDLSFGFLGTGAPVTGTSKSARKTIALNNAEFNSLLGNSTVQGYTGYVQPSSSYASASTPGISPSLSSYSTGGSPNYSPTPASTSTYSVQPSIPSYSAPSVGSGASGRNEYVNLA